jgi:prepilin-type N-terminal cleavage/methylation domain-containing protein
MKRHQSGFTLVEIAIVLVIIGLLLGGILKGQELVQNARVRNLADQQYSQRRRGAGVWRAMCAGQLADYSRGTCVRLASLNQCRFYRLPRLRS